MAWPARELATRYAEKILIVDYTTHHPEVVGALLTLFEAHKVRLAVTAGFQEKYLAPGGNDTLTAAANPLVRGVDESDEAWLARLADVIRDHDIVLFATPIKGPLLARTLDLPTAARKVLFLHNVNYFLDLEPLDLATFARLRAPRRLPLLQWPTYQRERRKQLRKAAQLQRAQCDFADLDRKVDFYCFGSESVAHYFETRSGRTNTLLLPTNVGSRGAPALPAYGGHLHIAIIGSVSPQRKDYRGVLTALIGADLRRPVTLSLLGSCPDAGFGRDLAALVASNSNPRLTIRFDPARRHISTEALRELLREVHVLLSPIQPDTEFRLHREIYGVSKVSGSEGDCLALGRPLLLPDSYVGARYAEPLMIHYADLRALVARIDGLNDAAALQVLYEQLQEFRADHIIAAMTATFLETVLPGTARE